MIIKPGVRSLINVVQCLIFVKNSALTTDNTLWSYWPIAVSREVLSACRTSIRTALFFKTVWDKVPPTLHRLVSSGHYFCSQHATPYETCRWFRETRWASKTILSHSYCLLKNCLFGHAACIKPPHDGSVCAVFSLTACVQRVPVLSWGYADEHQPRPFISVRSNLYGPCLWFAVFHI